MVSLGSLPCTTHRTLSTQLSIPRRLSSCFDPCWDRGGYILGAPKHRFGCDRFIIYGIRL